MEIYRSNDNQVTKFVHDDGSETAIKTVSSCQNVVDPVTGNVLTNEVEREKVSIFLSSSVGCPIGCKFCYLTAKKFPYYKLAPQQIFSNFCEAVQAAIEFDRSIQDRYVKVSWMGMGDVLLQDPEEIKDVTAGALDYLIRTGGFKGIDGVDVGTVLPHHSDRWPEFLDKIVDEIVKWPANPNNIFDRSPVRLFYSLHGVSNLGRKMLIPIHNDLKMDMDKLKHINEQYDIDIIFHYMFLEDINDSVEDIFVLKQILKYIDAELRILRFNECENSKFKESPQFNELVRVATMNLPRVKYQISAGSEIKAACGQFICKVSE